mmetsp:Transcript_27674/g.69694  ORF Transcript_27674/g.69694 Transcript_27674/m.69694 type:complete len:598 (+) Transcript_27674:75-1868(+)
MLSLASPPHSGGGLKPPTAGRAALGRCAEVVGGTSTAVRAIGSWALGLPGRLLGREGGALLIDAAVYATTDLPPVLLGRAADLPRALLQVRIDEASRKGGAAACAAAFAAGAAQASLDVLGGGFVKLAQVIAHSPALFPKGLVKACQKSLASAATPPASWEQLSEAVAIDLGVNSIWDVFQAFDPEPMASASIAQVHAAVLRSGERCVVKVVRPRVRERLAADLGGLVLLARFGDLVLGEDVVLQLVSASFESCASDLRCVILDECDLSLERRNMEAFRSWLSSSATLRRAGLARSVRVPRTFDLASASSVLTMERIDGAPLSELCRNTNKDVDAWQAPLVRALGVAALSVIEGEALFHADLHSGNMLIEGPTATAGMDSEQVVFIDFGCCGRIPDALRGALIMQASAFLAGKEPDANQFAQGFAYALQRMPGLGPGELDTEALAIDLKPLLIELKSKNPFRKGADLMKDPDLQLQLARLQLLLHRHGVQLPKEFTLLIKTGCFGALYFSLLDDRHRALLASNLALVGAAYASCNPHDARRMLSPATLVMLLRLLEEGDRGAFLVALGPWLRKGAKAAAIGVAAGVPLCLAAMQYLA